MGTHSNEDKLSSNTARAPLGHLSDWSGFFKSKTSSGVSFENDIMGGDFNMPPGDRSIGHNVNQSALTTSYGAGLAPGRGRSVDDIYININVIWFEIPISLNGNWNKPIKHIIKGVVNNIVIKK